MKALICPVLLTLSCQAVVAHEPAPPPRHAAISRATADPVPSVSQPNNSVIAIPNEARTDEARTQWRERLRRFYNADDSGPGARAEQYHALFADHLYRFISMRNISVADAIRAANTFLHDKKLLASFPGDPLVEPVADGERITFELQWSFSGPLPAELASQLDPDLSAHFGSEQLLSVELHANNAGRVDSYLEKPLRIRHFRVAGSVEMPARAFNDPHSPCEVGYEKLASEQPPVGTLLEDTCQYISLIGCGPGEERLRRVRLNGQLVWMLESIHMLMPNPNGGSSLGEVELLTRVD